MTQYQRNWDRVFNNLTKIIDERRLLEIHKEINTKNQFEHDLRPAMGLAILDDLICEYMGLSENLLEQGRIKEAAEADNLSENLKSAYCLAKQELS